VDAAESAIRRALHAVTDMAYFSARDIDPADYCASMVARADVYVGIIGLRYGATVPARPDLSFTEMEFDTATASGMPRLVFVIRDDAAPAGTESPEHSSRQRAFRRRLRASGLITASVATPADLEIELFQALSALTALAPPTVTEPNVNAGVPPDRKPLFVGRRSNLEKLARRLAASGRVDVTWSLSFQRIEKHSKDAPRCSTSAGLGQGSAAR
jgi:hypothetical protein